jgi:creatinine amidohydrolase
MTPACHPCEYRARYLPSMTRAQIEALPGKASAIVIIPTASIEQHGPHLPVGVDSILGQAWLGAALRHVPSSAPVYVGPAITYGKSNEHTGFPGTVSISARTLHRLLKTIARQLAALGFRSMAVLNTHGGNSAVLVSTLREIQTSVGINAGMLSFGWKAPLPPQEAAYGFHAGQFETALMLAIAPGLVAMDRAVCEFPARLEDDRGVGPIDAPATYGWLSADISKSGVMGDATVATVEDGRAWLDAGSRALAQQIVKLSENLRA